MNYLHKFSKILFLILFVAINGCEDDKGPITSNEIAITINSMNQSDINSQGIIEKDENISNNSGNPWSEFIKDSETECGSDAKYFEIVSVSVQLSDTENLDGFEDLITCTGEVYFINTQGSDDDAVRVLIGNSSSLKGKLPNELINLASINDLNILYDRLLGGDFHIGFKGETNLSKDDTFSCDVIIRFVVKAYCE
jgi:hypothetical protein